MSTATLRNAVASLAFLALTSAALAQGATPAPPAKPAETAPVPPPAPQAAPADGVAEPTEAAADPDMRKIAACKEHALGRLKQQSSAIEDIFIDVDGLTVAEADGKLGDTAVKGVLMGEAYIQRDRSDRANRFLCLTGENDEVLFTFFTER